MKLKEIIKELNVLEIKGSDDIDIKDIAYDSRRVRPGSLFVCIDGTVTDGHKYITSAILNGAAAILVEKDVDTIEGITIVRTDNTRFGLASTASRLFGNPSKKLNLIGVTGTKGKTTTTYLIKSIFEHAKKKVGLIGTIQNMIGDKVLYSERTTPESYDLQLMFSEMLDSDVRSCIMEVSSQGLNLDRVACCDYNVGVFTNLSRDHIGPGEHTDMEDYANAKAKLFKMCKKGLINIDSDYADVMTEHATCEVYTYGIECENMVKKPDFMARNIVKTPQGISFTMETNGRVMDIESSIPGSFSVYNALAAAGTALLSGIPEEAIVEGIKNVKVPGRAEMVPTGRDFSVIIDYAHNPDSFINILKTVKEYAQGKVVFLFGCGGDRRRPRELMGETAGKYADFSIITSDNPRTEDPESIIKDIEKGMKNTNGKYICITDRREAIKYAIMHAKADDVIILAGKGHETYQIFKDKQIHFDEREVVRDILEELETEGN